MDRATPPLNADEGTTLSAWLDFYRATLAFKCDGLSDADVRTASVPPSNLTLLGLVQHMAEVGATGSAGCWPANPPADLRSDR